MTKNIENVSQSIKSNLNFEDYTPSLPNALTPLQRIDLITECRKAVKTESRNDIIKSSKVKRTFYILEEVADKLDEVYAKKLTQKKKVDKSDIVTQALKNLFKDENCVIEEY